MNLIALAFLAGISLLAVLVPVFYLAARGLGDFFRRVHRWHRAVRQPIDEWIDVVSTQNEAASKRLRGALLVFEPSC